MTRNMTRRSAAAGLMALAATPAMARQREGEFVHRRFTVDLTAVAPDDRPELATYIPQQIDLVEGLAIRQDIKAWFRSVRIKVDPTLDMPGRFAMGRLTLDDETSPPDNPVLLHELLHGWHFQQMPGRRANPVILAFYRQALEEGAFPARSYMMSNVVEFFAMTASVALWGRAARPPRTRARLRQVMPAYYDWLIDHFGLTA